MPSHYFKSPPVSKETEELRKSPEWLSTYMKGREAQRVALEQYKQRKKDKKKMDRFPGLESLLGKERSGPRRRTGKDPLVY